MGERTWCAGMAEAILARHDPARMRWHHRDGFLLAALERASGATGHEGCRRFVRESLARLVGPDGAIAGYRREDSDLDQVGPGRLLFALRREADDPRWDNALRQLRGQLRAQPRTRSGGFWQRLDRPAQMWLNGAWASAPFLARWATEGGEQDGFREAVHQLLLLEEHARDPGTGLPAHAWDERRRQLWANPETGRSASAWGRGIGWFALAVVDVLELLPAGHPDRLALAAVLERLARALAAFQDSESGLWHQVVDQGRRPGNFLESSASCMFVCAIARGVRIGVLPQEPFTEVASRAWQGVRERFLSKGSDGLLDLRGTSASAGLGGTPYRDGSFPYYCAIPVATNDPRGLGAFLLASLEMES